MALESPDVRRFRTKVNSGLHNWNLEENLTSFKVLLLSKGKLSRLHGVNRRVAYWSTSHDWRRSEQNTAYNLFSHSANNVELELPFLHNLLGYPVNSMALPYIELYIGLTLSAVEYSRLMLNVTELCACLRLTAKTVDVYVFAMAYPPRNGTLPVRNSTRLDFAPE